MPQTAFKDSVQYAGKLLDQLRDLDATVHGAYYDMGRILSAILHGHLYDVLGYDSMGHLIKEELSFSPSQGFKYLHTYRHFKRLGYTKTEALDLISDFSFTHMAGVLPKLTDKVGKRAIKNAITKMLNDNRQINFALSKPELTLLIEALRAFGAEPKDGRLMNSSFALMEMVKSVLDD